MKDPENIEATIENYLFGKMDANSKAAFEKELAGDSNLSKQVELHRSLNEALIDKVALELEVELQKLGNEFALEYDPEKVSLSKPFHTQKLWIWFLVLLLLIGGYFISKYIQPTSKTHEKLYLAYFEDYEHSTRSRADNNEIASSEFEKLQALYQKQSYNNLLATLDNIGSDASTFLNQPEVLFLRGLSQQAIGKYSAALASYSAVIDSSPNDYVQQSYWYLALTEVKLGKIDEAKQSLRKLVNLATRGKYRTQAEKLLKDLK